MQVRSPLGAALLLPLALAACADHVPTAPGVGPAAPPALALAATPCGTSTTASLIADRTMPAGQVTVANDGTTLYVTYQSGGGWSLEETYLSVAHSADDIPDNPAGKP